jgi:VIT1/CCC1 family predicted Fe2+/Mn2+ transporter
LGIDPNELGSPMSAAVSSFLAFAVGALIPLLPWFFAAGTVALALSIGLSTVTALAVGAALARFTGRSMPRSALRQWLLAAVPATITFILGSIVGVGVG